MADLAKRLAGPAHLADAAATVYTVPAGKQAILKHITVVNSGPSAVTWVLSVGPDAPSARLYSGALIDRATTWEIDTWVVLEAGETLQAFAAASGVITLTLNGVEVTP